MMTSKFDVFKEITIGGLSKEQLLQLLSEAGIQFNQYANTLFDHPHFLPSTQVKKVKLVKTTLAAMELSESCSFEEFSNQATALGLKLCPPIFSCIFKARILGSTRRTLSNNCFKET